MKSKTFTLILALFITHFAFETMAQRAFDTKVDYSTGNYPTSVAIGDLNGDGKLDLAVTNNGSNTISLFTNTGNGSLGAKVDYPTGLFPISIVIGDLNGDGKLDLAVTNNGSNTISVLTGTGSGGFGTNIDYTTGYQPYSLAMGDLNGDGKLDLAVTNNGSNTISILTNTGNGTFGVKIDYPTGTNPRSVTIGDFNNDNQADLAVVNTGSNTISVLNNTGNGVFGDKLDYESGTFPFNIASGDINGDGTLDLAVANRNSNTVSVLTNTGNGSFGSKVDYGTGTLPRSIAMGDLNGDSNLDLAVVNSSNLSLSVLTNLGNGSFGTKIDYVTGSNPYSISIGDLNGDGKTDLTVANNGSNTISVFLAKDSQQIGGFLPNSSIHYGSIFSITATSSLTVQSNSSNTSVLSFTGNSARAIGVGVVTITAFQSGNGSWFGVTTTGVVTVTKANLTVSANNFSRVYGSPNPTFTASYNGLVFNETVTSSFSLGNQITTSVGSYFIYPSVSGAALVNYDVTTVAGTLTVTPAPLTIMGFNYSITYGEPIPAISGTVVGVVNGDAIPVNYLTTVTQFAAPGIYYVVPQITPNAVNIGNYQVSSVLGIITVLPKPATVLGFNATKLYGEPNPTFTGTILGIVNNDDIAFSASTSANSLSGVGTYPIQVTATGANITNYGLQITNSTLIISKAILTVTAFNVSKIENDPMPITIGYAITGFKNGDTESVFTSPVQTAIVGNVVSVSGAAAANYDFVYINGTYTETDDTPVFSNISCSIPCKQGSIITLTGSNLNSIVDFCFKRNQNQTVCINTFTVSGTTLLLEIPVNALPGEVTVTCSFGKQTYFVTDFLTSVFPSEDQMASFAIYPNPSNGTFTIENLSAASLPYEIADVLGNKVQTGILQSGDNQIESTLSQGIYYLSVKGIVKKLVIQ